MVTKEEIKLYFEGLQDQICAALEQADGAAKFHEDLWIREAGGGGRSRVIQKGNVIEKGGVMFSAVWGDLHEKMLASMGLKEKVDFFATGVSIVIHPQSPMVPIIHMNVRYFEMSNGVFWFGGGIDLTPHYIVDEDAQWFHQQLKDACDKHNAEYYPKFRTWADDYFFNAHRNETRGIGGIFFDYQKVDETRDKNQLFEFVKSIGEAFAPIYTHYMNKNKDIPYTEREKEFQALRRGRYVEFNLVHDRGTKFGLETNGRTESILMSMPPMAQWVYNYQAEEGSEEERTLSLLKKGMEWV
ncbi:MULTISPECIES: oxygen-dependent coproporphyrinogen oxidase [Flectobacillus]|jgi:coproporphyrinogen III oxidase|uniref:oxygen-dependent coproporphyrinogen oxidase n=1 Tax=Flectobacillus TaxID=101 RepID=UPI000BA3A336|nr:MULTISPECIES: oxygen-dependent coproporphyrinogen oxidase [Flectobacillus]MDI9868869.1 oxygen-dependent coproporphyrinogen oxidase [Flectobacillus roseus]NBA74182.1 oxygen-dependent coproporphyrinogen oxidase [Emticicia sp. ODNR4P]PAC30753.1 coproporphyrinogen III oxidase [Flectobacillus sp. BAB-3569]